jgi:F-type H+-transporting ATPase subunit epsilon
MADSFQLEIVTPEKLVVKDRAEEMQIPGKNGYLGILPGHAPLISELAVGQISYRNGSQTHYLCVAWGFAEVLPDKVTILAETAERGEDVDCARAQKSKERAERRLSSGDTDVDVPRAQNALARANARLEAAGKEGQTVSGHS